MRKTNQLSRRFGSSPPAKQIELPAILFDLDGTLIDSNYQHVDAWSEALLAAGIIIPRWKIHRRVGMSGKSMVQELLRELPRKPRKINLDQLEQHHDARFRRAVAHLQPLPGANELLKHLCRDKIRVAIATTGGRGPTALLLKRLEIPAHIPIVTGDDVEKAKPSPDVFTLAADRLNIAIDNCIVVGDSVWDLLAAVRKSALGVGFLSGGYGQEELERAGAFRVYSDAADMLMHIEQLGLPGK
ncbi:MAG TPA: HAD family hydrolase [Candidatus Sulfotelmatobacter sp.]|nr:HAD family hydrolase [Candidatus Sulfotelmatobacter sp.]